MAKVFISIGSGPGLGLAVARRFGREGWLCVVTTAQAEQADDLRARLADDGVASEGAALDLADPEQIRRLVDDIGRRHGRIDVLHFNPSIWRERDPLQLTVDELLADVAIGVGALLPAVQAARPHFAPGARVLVTGSAAADTPWHGAASLGVQKAALRNLVTSVDAVLAGDGVRAVAVQINGVLAKDGPFSPAPIADAMWAAVARDDEHWTPHVPYDGSGRSPR
ncbi:MAG: SDR family NAD(P)-dependent oxidoreductase [Jatrophihabitans sp.]|uniref:SDR family NAD(P)-dependent oxidoreductase n=1 Tax=Jatrophihabitans sp. TaxID=1932789 RepID=UPI003F7CD830